MDLMAFGGPAGPCYAQQVAWQRPTQVLSVSAGTERNTSTDQAAVYAALAAQDGYAWKAMCSKAGIDPADLGNLGIGGFSAFHGFANAMLENPIDAAKCCYVHLADACFLGAGATTPHQGYAAFAKKAALGIDNKLMVATTNGPWGKDLSYSYTYPEGDTVSFNLTSGAECFNLVWNAAVSADMSVSVPDVPPGIPTPTRAMRVGNLLWFHYETMTAGLPHPCGGEYTQHGWHCVALATPFMQMYGAPWMAGQQGGLMAGLGLSWPPDGSTLVKGAIALGVAGLAAYMIWNYLGGGLGGGFLRNARVRLLEPMPKRCAKCGLIHDESSWQRLRLLGYTPTDMDDEEIEWRNCPCGSTLARLWQTNAEDVDFRA